MSDYREFETHEDYMASLLHDELIGWAITCMYRDSFGRWCYTRSMS
jgi:hypothetical protein